MEKPLTAKQEAFAQAVADGMTLTDAFKRSYDTTKYTPKSVNEKASQLMANVKIKSRIEELKAKLEAKALWSREDSVNVLKQVAKLGLDPESHAKAADAVNAVATLNKMHGYDAPQQIELQGTGEIRLNIVRGGSV